MTARCAARTRSVHCSGGGFRVAVVFAPPRAHDTAGTGAVDRPGGLHRAVLAALLLQKLAYQLLVPPVQFPFEVTDAHLAGFARGEEGFGPSEDGLGRARGRAGASDAGGMRAAHRRRGSRRCHGHGGLPPFPRHRTRTARQCPGGAPRGPSTAACWRVIRSGWLPERGLGVCCTRSMRTGERSSAGISPYESVR